MPKYLEMSAEVVVDLAALFTNKPKQDYQATDEETKVIEEVKDTKDK